MQYYLLILLYRQSNIYTYQRSFSMNSYLRELCSSLLDLKAVRFVVDFYGRYLGCFVVSVKNAF